MTEKIYHFRTIEIRAVLLRRTMMRIVCQLSTVLTKTDFF